MDGSELNAIFSARVRALAEERGWSVNQLADFSGLGRGFVSELLRGLKSPSLDTVAKIALALEIEPWKLLKPEEPGEAPRARVRTGRRDGVSS